MTFDEWKDDYGLVYEQNYCEGTEADCLAAFKAGASSRDDEVEQLSKHVAMLRQKIMEASKESAEVWLILREAILENDQRLSAY